VTHYGQKVENNLLPKLFDDLEASAAYRQRRLEITEFNEKSLGHPHMYALQSQVLRGLSMTAVKFGISFTTRFLNQGNALVNVHRDGSVQVSTGAVEMGQGVNTRIGMLVAEELGITLDRVRLFATATDKNANTSPTAASTGTDINGAAAVIACRRIKERLAALAIQLSERPESQWPSKTAGLGTAAEILIHEFDVNKALTKTRFDNNEVSVIGSSFKIPFPQLIVEAYFNRISLGEYGFHKTENLGFDKIKGQGQAFQYFTQGTAVSEVEINRLTGEIKVRRVDILMDLGRPINEGLDIGQVTGAFIQGMGWVTTENLVYNEEGLLLTHSPSTYKIPSVQDTPRVFQVQLAHNLDNVVNIRGTKAVGEPPLLLALSVWTAVKDAIGYASRSNPETLAFNRLRNLPIPATAETTLRHLHPELFTNLEVTAETLL
jgi:xanthine dehydrogenase large subunit